MYKKKKHSMGRASTSHLVGIQKISLVISMGAYGAGANIRYLADGQHVFIPFNIGHFQRGRGQSGNHITLGKDTEQLAGKGRRLDDTISCSHVLWLQ